MWFKNDIQPIYPRTPDITTSGFSDYKSTHLYLAYYARQDGFIGLMQRGGQVLQKWENQGGLRPRLLVDFRLRPTMFSKEFQDLAKQK